ncbi:MucBP domain-containing protein [Enterococcus cecorum]|uniref:MucBP domain-containing protein n=1 Tax=Enterococcus cecorum TaxID=44008 RepID=UPI00326706D8
MIKIGHLKISILNMGDEEVRNQTERQLKFGLKKKKGGGGAASFIIGSVLLGAMIATPVIANNQNAVVFAAESADTTSGTDTYNYQTNPLLINKVWNLVERIPFNKNINDLLLDKGYTTNAYKLATTTIGDENNEVNATVTITPLKDAYEGISVLQEGKNQASYAATSDMFIGNPNPSKMPALGILTQPAPDEGGNDWSSKFNFNGDFPVAILKISFDKVVTNPVIDVSGIGGSTSTDYLYHENFVYARGSFNSTVLELLDSDVSLKTASGVNLTDGSKEIRVKERNTYYRAVLNDGEKDIEYDTSEYNTNSPKLVPAGTGSIQVLGDVKEISFKVYHSATPYSAFPTETYGTSENFFRKDKSDPLMADGTNGLNKHWREEYRHENDPKKEFITSNDDLFHFSLRLPSASVTVHYVDENGNQIKDDEIDTPTSVTGTSYDTTDNKHKEIQGKDGKYYTLLPEEKAVKEGSAAETGTLKDKNLEVTYVYQLNGAVKERHVIKDTETELFNEDGTETARTLAEPGSKIGTAYQGEQKSTTLYDADGNMYKPTDDKDGREDNATGSVKVEEQTVTFEYAPVKGNVVVHYVDENGNTIPGVNSQDVKEGNVTKEGNPYDTTTETYRPQTVTATDGTKYELVSTTPKAGSASATGNLVEGTQEVTYVYKKVPAHKVTVTYVDTEGKEIKAPVVDEASLQEGKAYDTAVDNKPQTIEFEGKKYEFVKHEEDSASETGTMADKDLTVTYVYRLVEEKPEIKGGEVKERHVIQGTETELVDENGQATSAIVKAAGSEIGEAYNTQPKEGYLYDAQGNAYKAIDDNDGRENNASGVVTAAEQTVTFEYAPVKGNVVVNYEDEEGNPIPGVDAKDVVRDGNVTKEGNPYDTTTETYRPQTVTATDGTVYELVKETPKDGSAPAEGTVKEGTQEVTYVYKKVPAHKVTVTYVDTEGKEIKAPVVDEASLQEGKAYDTAVDNKPQTIEFEGKKYEFVKHEEDSASETGTMADKDLTVTYVYRLVEEKPEIKGGEVKERHVIQGTETELVDENGQATSAIVKAAGSEIGEAYNTQPKEGYLYDAQGNAYKAIDDNDGRENNASGVVTAAEQTVTFEYAPVKGNVVVNYEDEEGNPIPGVDAKDVVRDGNVTKEGNPYDTTTETYRPQTVTATDGTVYELVKETPKDGSAPAEGTVKEGTQEVTYVYKKVPAHKVTVTYVDTEGKEIKAPVVDEASLQEGKAYDTAVDNKPQTIEFEGKKYEFVKHEEDSASETGTMADKDLTVTYVYRLVEEKPEIKGGEVKERHVIQGTETELVDENGQATSAIVKAVGSEIGEAYNTQPKEGYLYDAQGNAYKAIDDNDGREDNAQGKVTDKAQTVTFEYTPVKGNVVVHYVDENGNTIPGVNSQDVKEGNVTKSGTPYDTTTQQFRPQTVVATDGTKYELVSTTPKAGSASATGNLVEGTQEVTYVYRKVVEQNPEVKGGQVVERHVIQGTETELVDANGQATTAVVKEAGSTIGEAYSTQPKSGYLYDAQGNAYKAIGDNDGRENNAQGKVTELNQTVTFEYTPVKGNVVVHYVDENGNTIPGVNSQDVKEGNVTKSGTPYDTTTQQFRPQTVVATDGTKYELVSTTPKAGSASATGNLVEGTQEVTYVYRKVVEQNPEVKGGQVVERHVIQGTETELVDANGQATTVVVKEAGSTIGEAYSTQPKSGYLYDAQGNAYKAIGDNDGRENNAQGKVTELNQTVTFEYAPVKGNVIVDYVDEAGNPIPGVPAKDVVSGNVTKEGNPYDTRTAQFRPQIIISSDGTRYELVSTTPKDGSAFAKGNIKEGTQTVTYVYRKVATHTVTINYVDTDGNTIKQSVVDETALVNGEAYDTTDEGDKPKEIKVNGKVYELVKITEDSAPEKGKMGDKDLSVTYVYKLKQKGTTVKSSKSAPVSKNQLPKAGSNQTNPVVGVMSLAMASLLAIVAKFKKEETK